MGCMHGRYSRQFSLLNFIHRILYSKKNGLSDFLQSATETRHSPILSICQEEKFIISMVSKRSI